jgi:hypothetical protein
VTPVVRRLYYSDGPLDRSKLRPYAKAMIAVAKGEKISCFDLNQESFRFFEELGSAKSAKLNAGSGGADFTHFNAEGAKKITAMVAAFLRQDMPETFQSSRRCTVSEVKLVKPRRSSASALSGAARGESKFVAVDVKRANESLLLHFRRRYALHVITPGVHVKMEAPLPDELRVGDFQVAVCQSVLSGML